MVVSGVFISTALTLIVVPVFYSLLGKYTQSPEAVSRELERLQDAHS